jgi:hypothetical protein
MRSAFYKVMFAAVVLAVAGWWVHDKLRDSKIKAAREKHRSEQTEQGTAAMQAAVAHHNAIAGWQKPFDKSLSAPFSLQLDKSLVQTNGRPVLVQGFVEDISRRGETYAITVNDWHVGGAIVHFVLECDAATADRLIAASSSFLEIAVIAKIESVDKAQIALKSGVQRSEDEAPVEIDAPSIFIAKGHCVEVLIDNPAD